MSLSRVSAYRSATDDGEILITRRMGEDGIDMQVVAFGCSTALTLTWRQLDDIADAAKELRGAGQG